MSGNIISRYAFCPPVPSYDVDLPGLFFVDSIPCIQFPLDLPYPITLLYSHGNAEDLGLGSDYFISLSDELGVNVVSYDYQGYGLHPGVPSEENVMKNSISVFEYLVSNRHSKIIVAGRSLGSAPAIHIAAEKREQCCGLILISPLSSAIRVVSEYSAFILHWVDVFCNIDKIKEVKCPTLIIHGDVDEVIPLKHAIDLAANCGNLHRLEIVKGGTHNNAKTTRRFSAMRSLVSSISTPTF